MTSTVQNVTTKNTTGIDADISGEVCVIPDEGFQLDTAITKMFDCIISRERGSTGAE